MRAFLQRFLPHPDPLPEGEGKNVHYLPIVSVTRTALEEMYVE
jgi:hypothetical protein